MQRGFSLVELSIVLVILGLLTGGILAGQSLIRAAELRSVSTDYQRYTAAIQTFRDKYFAQPGDMVNATKFWGKDSAQCNGAPEAAGTPGTCNGNGDGFYNYPAAANGTGEAFRFWQQLALANLIEGSFTGNAGSASASDALPGSNVPRSRLNNGAWGVFPFPQTITVNGIGGGWINFEGNWGNQLVLGSKNGAGWYEAPLLKAEETWNIDTKMDDGKPGTGNLRVYEYAANCHDATPSAAVAVAGTANYRLSDTTANACTLLFNL